MSEPLYWRDLDWRNGWDDSKPTRVATSEATLNGSRRVSNGSLALNVMPQNTAQLIAALKNFETAFLPTDSYEYRSIERYLRANAAARTLRPPQGERTRLVRAQAEIRTLKAKAALDDADRAKMRTHLRTLLEDTKYVTDEFRPLYATYGIPIKTVKPVKSGQVRLTNIRVVRNVDLWTAYEGARDRIAQDVAGAGKSPLTTGGKAFGRSKVEFTTKSDSGLTPGSPVRLPVLDKDLGEVLLMHGTSPAVIQIISNAGFNPTFNQGTPDKHGVVKYGALGQGTYFGDSFAKVQTYIGCPLCCALKCDCVDADGDPMERMVILARCLIGVPTKARTHDSHRPDSAATLKGHKHSVIGQESGFFKSWSFFGSNEFLLKSADQMYPEFVVSWIRE